MCAVGIHIGINTFPAWIILVVNEAGKFTQTGEKTGDAWNAFKESISTSGIIEPIVVTQDMVIVSGHQRVRAAKELNMSTIMVDIRKYENDDKVLKDLIETNIRQRGIGNPNPIKLGRCIKELERIYGVRDGSTNSKGIGVSSARWPTRR